MAKATRTERNTATKKVETVIHKNAETPTNTIVEKNDTVDDDSDFEKPLEQPAFNMPPLDITTEIGAPTKEIKFDHSTQEVKPEAPIEVELMPPTINGKFAPSSAPIEAPKHTAYVGQKLKGTTDVVTLVNRVGMQGTYNRKEAERLIKQNPDCYKEVI